MRHTRMTKVAAFGAIAALTVAACGSDDDSGGDEPDTTEADGAAATTEAMEETDSTDAMEETDSTDAMEETDSSDAMARRSRARLRHG